MTPAATVLAEAAAWLLVLALVADGLLLGFEVSHAAAYRVGRGLYLIGLGARSLWCEARGHVVHEIALRARALEYLIAVPCSRCGRRVAWVEGRGFLLVRLDRTVISGHGRHA